MNQLSTTAGAARTSLLCLTLLLLAWTFPTVVQGQPVGGGERYALLVGVHTYDKVSGLRPLAYTENDVTRMAELLYQSGYRPENIVLMTETRAQKNARFLPEREKIWREIRTLMRDRKPEDSLLVAFAGHGVEFKGNEDNYFCPLDARIEQRKTLISMKELYKELGDCKAGVKVLFVDACRNDPVTQSARGLDVLEEVNRVPLQPPGGIAAFFSCSEKEAAYEDANLKHGVFFHFLIEAMLGAGDLDKDEAITLPELELYVKRRVADYVRDQFGGNRQMPNLKGNTRGLVALVRLADLETPKPSMFGDLYSRARGKITVNGIGMTFVQIKGGDGWMGRDAPETSFPQGFIGDKPQKIASSEPLHPIRITKPYNLGIHEVTQREYQKVMGKNPSFFSASGKGRHLVEGLDTRRFPVEQVSWLEACEFCRRLSALPSEKAANRVYRLPTEAEWEFACRGLDQESPLLKQLNRAAKETEGSTERMPTNLTSQLLFHFGSDNTKLDSYGWYKENSGATPHIVEGLKPNQFGIYDMYGNVREWCADWYIFSYFNAHMAGANPIYRKIVCPNFRELPHNPGDSLPIADQLEFNTGFVVSRSRDHESAKDLFFSGGQPVGLLPIIDPPAYIGVLAEELRQYRVTSRVLRGGFYADEYKNVMSDSRLGGGPNYGDKTIGFRVVFDKFTPIGHEFQHAYNMRRDHLGYVISHTNVRRFADQDSGAQYFAPKNGGEWAEITFRYDLPFVIASARLKLRVAVLQKLDPKAQIEVLVSKDGKRWITSAKHGQKETGAKTFSIELSKETKGARTVFIRIRAFSSLDGGNGVWSRWFSRSPASMKLAAAQILRDEDDTNVYEFHATGMPDSNKTDETLQHLQNSLDADPGNVATRIAIGLASAKQGDFDEAIVQFRAVGDLTPNNALSHYYLGLTLLAGGKAKSRLKSPVQQNEKRIDEAITHLKLAVGIRPGNLIRPSVGSADAPTGELEIEDAKFRLATGTNRIDARAYYELGRALLLAGFEFPGKDRPSEAMAYFTEAVRAGVPLSFLLHELEVAVLKENLATLGRVLKKDKDNVRALFSRGNSRYHLGNHQGAREDLERILKLNPQHANALNLLAWLLATSSENELRDGKQAIKLALQANDLSQYKDPSILSTLAAAYAETGNYEKAVEWSSKAITLFPRDKIPEQFKVELKSYQQQKPWREKADPTSLVKDRK